MIQTYSKSKDLSVMVWGAIWLGGRSDLVFMERDMKSKAQGYTSWSYSKVLDDQLPRIWSPGLTFMQDNAPIHTSNVIKQWFEDHGITPLPWPPYSPDLNPIEHVWVLLKRYINEHFPHLLDGGKSIADEELLCEAIERAWNTIDQEEIDHLIRSIGRRTNAVWKALGWHTKY
jgi:transposase